MANPVLLQKQIKDNSEDLHNFVRDLKLWEDEMKRKDRQLSNDQSEEILPPVRRPKIVDKTSNNIQAQKENKNNKIPSYDYKKWDSFDVDKACEEIDNEENQSEEVNDVDVAKQEENYLKQKALYEKELGNQYVKASKWDEAIDAYTKAIAAYPKDPIFFANRALCYLKKKKFDAVDADCTESLKLDTTYVKAYLRRAAASEALGRLEDARHDLYQVLQLEPNNSQAQRDLARIKAAAVVGDKKNTVKKTISNGQTTLQVTNQKKTVSQKLETSGETSLPFPNENKNDKANSTLKSEVNKIGVKTSTGEPNWQPCNNTVQAVCKPPHLRSTKSLKRVEIYDVGFNCPEHKCARKISKPQETNVLLPSTVQEDTPGPSGEKLKSVLTMNTSSRDVPPPPKTSVQFHMSWNGIKADDNLCYNFLKQIPGEDLPSIFKESLESCTFSSIVHILASQFTAADEPVLPYLKGLSGVRRFSTIVLFMTSTDKFNLLKLFEYCIHKEECSHKDINELRRTYEMI